MLLLLDVSVATPWLINAINDFNCLLNELATTTDSTRRSTPFSQAAPKMMNS
jgi:hypothetical protein